MEKKWQVYPKVSDDIVKQLLANRGLACKDEAEEFLNPPSPWYLVTQSSSHLHLDQDQLSRAVEYIKKAVSRNQPIIIHGDFDVDGICGTAILWEALYYGLGYENVSPFIPDRFGEGYGLSTESIEKISCELDGRSARQPTSANEKAAKLPSCPAALLITVDCGITALKAVNYAKSLGMEVIITDHHTKAPKLPDAEAIVWTDGLSGTGIAWVLATQLGSSGGLDLVALATIADLRPLLGANRALVKAGLEELNRTQRVGLKVLIKEAGLEGKDLGPYEVGWILAPRLNAAGRLENALFALRLLCTRDEIQAAELAERLSVLNAERQRIMGEVFEHAREQLTIEQPACRQAGLTIVAHESYHEGVIGLVASKLVQEYYRPSIVISKGEKYSKGSARSVDGFSIIDALREVEHLFEDMGGHPMAAGFTIKTEKIAAFSEELLKVSARELPEDLLQPVIKIDVEVEFSDLTTDLFEELKKFEPHGIGNPKPVFLTRGVEVRDARPVGADGRHLKLLVTSYSLSAPNNQFAAIFFNCGDLAKELFPGDKIDLVYNLEENIWNGQRILEFKIKDLRKAG